MSHSDLQISVSGSLPQPQIEMVPAAFEARRVALEAAGKIKAIASVADLDAAAAALKITKALLKSVEDSRKEVKAPVLEVGKRIDSVAREYLASLEKEASRLSTLVGSYQEAKRMEAERIREEEARKQREALEEMQRKQSVAMASGDTEAADAARADAALAIATSQLAVEAAEGAKADGITTRSGWKFEVTNIQELFAAHPGLCVIEPNNAAIRAFLKSNNGNPVPGLRIWREAAAVVRAAAPVNLNQYDY